MPPVPPSTDTLDRLRKRGYDQDACLSALLDATGSEEGALELLRARHPEGLPPPAVMQVDAGYGSPAQAIIVAVVPAGGLAQPAPLVMDVRPPGRCPLLRQSFTTHHLLRHAHSQREQEEAVKSTLKRDAGSRWVSSPVWLGPLKIQNT